jgi:hypothetical protein
VISADSTGSEGPLVPANVHDGKPDTKWVSDDIETPRITLLLSQPSPICRVDITWADSDTRYMFTIATSLDGNKFSYVFAGSRIGYSTTPETYTFPATLAQYVKISIINSTLGVQNQVAISEIEVFS